MQWIWLHKLWKRATSSLLSTDWWLNHTMLQIGKRSELSLQVKRRVPALEAVEPSFHSTVTTFETSSRRDTITATITTCMHSTVIWEIRLNYTLTCRVISSNKIGREGYSFPEWLAMEGDTEMFWYKPSFLHYNECSFFWRICLNESATFIEKNPTLLRLVTSKLRHVDAIVMGHCSQGCKQELER